MKTNTQYVESADKVKRYSSKFISYAEAYEMGKEKLQKHIDALASEHSHAHEICIFHSYKYDNAFRHDKYIGNIRQRIAKRYRVKNRG